MARQLTIRGVPDEVGRQLRALGEESGKSVNTIVLEILETALGESQRRRRLERYATWSREDLESFERALKEQRVIDDELWH